MIAAGKYIAKVKDYGIGTTKAGDPKAMVLLTFKDENGKDQEMTWTGSLKEGRGREISIDALLVCGLKDNDLTNFSKGAESGALDLDSDVQITVEHEMYEEKNIAKVKWINRPGGAAFRNKLESGEAVKKLSGLNLGGDISARRKETGIKPNKPEIPF